MKSSLKTARIGKECVACGVCRLACPRKAIDIMYGVSARVDEKLCVGCGICAKACPAAVINITQREGV